MCGGFRLSPFLLVFGGALCAETTQRVPVMNHAKAVMGLSEHVFQI